MNTPARLALFGTGLAAVFAVAALTASAVVPGELAAGWRTASEQGPMNDEGPTMQHGEESTMQHDDETHVGGLGIAADGYLLDAVTAPAQPGVAGELRFRILDPDGDPLLDYEVEHEQRLHLIVVRSDGAHYVHGHPTLADDGTWSLPWTWDAAGSYRVIADFTTGGTGTTLSSTVDVAGEVTPIVQPLTSTAQVEGYDIVLDGQLRAGHETTLTATVTRDGQPVAVQPYLGADGHLVALREGDLGYLHVHPMDGLAFAASVPTAGRYLLYLDVKIDGQVLTVPFVLEARA